MDEKTKTLIVDLFWTIKDTFQPGTFLYPMSEVEARAREMHDLTTRVHEAIGYTLLTHVEDECPLCAKIGGGTH